MKDVDNIKGCTITFDIMHTPSDAGPGQNTHVGEFALKRVPQDACIDA